MKHLFFIFISLFFLFNQNEKIFAANESTTQSNEAVYELINRILPNHSTDFKLETIPSVGNENIFEVEAINGKIVLRGDNNLSQSVAFNWYLKNIALVNVSWFADDAVNVIKELPLPITKVRKLAKQYRNFELRFVNSFNTNYAAKQSGNYYYLSAELYKKYAPKVANN